MAVVIFIAKCNKGYGSYRYRFQLLNTMVFILLEK
jgi:hypothetical protein